MCTGRIDPSFILRAFANGTDGVFVGGCWLGECHYLTNGNYEALSMMLLCKKVLQQIGIDPARLRLEFVSASQGSRFAEVVTDFTSQLRELGPIGIDAADGGRTKLEAARSLVPYLKLVERERLRVHFQTEEEYRRFFNSDEADRIYRETIGDELTTREVLLVLRDNPLAAEAVAEVLGLSPSEASRHLNRSLREGLVKFDAGQRHYALALG
jgi:F420-non-reducing hydrogenase iron-sulfur subunit